MRTGIGVPQVCGSMFWLIWDLQLNLSQIYTMEKTAETNRFVSPTKKLIWDEHPAHGNPLLSAAVLGGSG